MNSLPPLLRDDATFRGILHLSGLRPVGALFYSGI